MNQNFQRSLGTLLLPLLLLIVLLSTNKAGVDSRLLPTQTTLGSDGYLNADKRVLGHDVGEINEEEGSLNVMELEDPCEDADEECLKRRMTYEAHLDYIYTQHHKP